MKLLVFILFVGSVSMQSARADEALDPRMRRLVGTWDYDRSDKWDTGTLTINQDMSIRHSKYGDGDIRHIAADRYELTLYDGTGYEFGDRGHRCQLLIRPLANGQMSVTMLNIGDEDFDFYRCQYGLLTKKDTTPLIGVPILPPKFVPFPKTDEASEASK